MTTRRGLGAVRRFAWAAFVFACGQALGNDARADVIVLRGGGQVRGKVLPDPGKPDKVTVVLERGKTPLTLQKAQVVRVDAEPGPLDGYVVRRSAAAATAQAQFDLALYCEQNHLPDLAQVHLESAVKLDKNFGPAHEKLGHAKVAGRWLSGDELREAQGLVRVKGKWITPEEKQELDKAGESAAEQTAWVRRLRLWRDAIVGGPSDRRREAETQLLSIRDAAAVGPLVRVLGEDGPELRGLLAKSLGAIPGPEAASALVRRLLGESDADVRGTVMDALKGRNEPEVAKRLVQALHSKEPEVVNRAAWGLSNVDAVSAVPTLVSSLITTKTRMVLAPSAGGPAEGNAISASFGGYSPVTFPGAAPVAYNGSSVGYLTGPTVGPGVVAFGATSVPAYPALNPMLSPTSSFGIGGGILGGGGLAASRGPSPRMITETFQNTEVLSALVKLTGEDFGYNVDAWKRWLRTSFQPDPLPARRVPQP